MIHNDCCMFVPTVFQVCHEHRQLLKDASGRPGGNFSPHEATARSWLQPASAPAAHCEPDHAASASDAHLVGGSRGGGGNALGLAKTDSGAGRDWHLPRATFWAFALVNSGVRSFAPSLPLSRPPRLPSMASAAAGPAGGGPLRPMGLASGELGVCLHSPGLWPPFRAVAWRGHRRFHESPQYLLVILPRNMTVSAYLCNSPQNFNKTCADASKTPGIGVSATDICFLQQTNPGKMARPPGALSPRRALEAKASGGSGTF